MRSMGIFLISLSVALFCNAGPASGQCMPKEGAFDRSHIFLGDNVYDCGPYHLTKSPEEIEVKMDNSTIFTHSTPEGYISRYFFYGPGCRYLLIMDHRTGSVWDEFYLYGADLLASQPQSVVLSPYQQYDHSDDPQLKVQTSYDNGQVVLYYFKLNSAGGTQDYGYTFVCVESGEVICTGPGPFSPQQEVWASADNGKLFLKDGGNELLSCDLSSPAGPIAKLEPWSLDFGRLLPSGEARSRHFTIHNEGDEALNIQSISIGDFDEYYDYDDSEAVIEPGDNIRREITFDPSGADAGFYNTTLSIHYNGANSPAILALVAEVINSNPPDWPYSSELTAEDIEETHLKLVWTPAEDDVGVTAYQVWQIEPEEILYATVDGDVLSYHVDGLESWSDYKFKVEAGDADDNWTDDGPDKWVKTADKTPPSWPAGSSLTVSNLTPTSFTLHWTDATDNGELEYYKLYLIEGSDTRLLGYTFYGENSYSVGCLVPNSTFSIKVEAEDVSQNESTGGPEIDVTTLDGPDVCAEELRRVSVNSEGLQGEGEGIHFDSRHATSKYSAISADGRLIAFESEAGNLVPNDNNSYEIIYFENGWSGHMEFWYPDIFVHDQLTGQTERVSVSSEGAETPLGSFSSSASMDGAGRYVAFASSGDNLAPGDTNEKNDIFIHDRQTKQTIRINYGPNGEQGNGHSGLPTFSLDGQYVLFHSEASNFVEGDDDDEWDVFLYHRPTGEISLISKAPEGSPGNGDSWAASISADNRFIAFASEASNLVDGDNNGRSDVFLYDLQSEQMEKITQAFHGGPSNGNSVIRKYPSGHMQFKRVATSANGQFIAFDSEASNLVSDDTNGKKDVFLYDRQTGETHLASRGIDGAAGNWASDYPSLSANGRYLAFASSASNLVPGDHNSYADIFVFDRLQNTTRRISTCACGGGVTEANFSSNEPVFSGNGRFVAFRSMATNLVPNLGDTNDSDDVFLFSFPDQEEDTDQDGVADVYEQGYWNNDPLFDGNGDGQPDWQQQNVASLPDYFGAAYLNLEALGTATFSHVHATGNPDADNAPQEEQFSLNFLSYTLHPTEATAEVILQLPEDRVPLQFYQYGPTPDNPSPHWYAFEYDGETGAVITGNTIHLYYRDGGRGDDDRLENGLIEVGVTGPAWPIPPTPQPAIVVDPEELFIGHTYPGFTRCATFTVINVGDRQLTVYSITSADTLYQITPGQFTVAPADSQEVMVTFAPPIGTPAGDYSGAIIIASNDPDRLELAVPCQAYVYEVDPLEIFPKEMDFGHIVIGESISRTLRIQNSTDHAVAVESMEFSVPFYDAQPQSGEILPLDSLQITVTFSPTEDTPEGTRTDVLTIVHDFADLPPLEVGLQSHVYGIPEVQIEPTVIDFGEVARGESAEQYFLISNTGTGSIRAEFLSPDTLFTTDPQLTDLAPGSRDTVRVSFAPTEDTPLGTREANLTVVYIPAFPSDTVHLMAQVTAGESRMLDVKPTELNFGEVAVNKTAILPLAMRNQGTDTLTITGFRIQSDPAGIFHITPISYPTRIPPGETAATKVVFQPAQAIDYSGVLAFESDATVPTPVVPLSGSGKQGFPWMPVLIAAVGVAVLVGIWLVLFRH